MSLDPDYQRYVLSSSEGDVPLSQMSDYARFLDLIHCGKVLEGIDRPFNLGELTMVQSGAGVPINFYRSAWNSPYCLARRKSGECDPEIDRLNEKLSALEAEMLIAELDITLAQ